MAPIDPADLERFRRTAEAHHTDALVVLQAGEVLLDWRRPGVAPRFEAMSVTKSIASLVLGRLVDDGGVALDERLARYFPEWADDPRGDITLRQVLGHTSGLADEATTRAIYESKDFVRFALDAPLAHAPGTRFFYSNRASNLVAGIVRRQAGMELGAFAKRHVFASLGVEDVEWWEDPAGHTQVMSGLQIRPEDLAKLGQLVLDEGQHRDHRLVSRTWLEISTRTLHDEALRAPPHGLFWWLRPKDVEIGFDAALFAEWEESGMPRAFMDELRPLEGRFFARDDFYRAVYTALTGKVATHVADSDLREWYAHTTRAKRRDGAIRRSGVATIRADGWLGQYLLVLPAERLVVVRLRHAPDPAREDVDGSFASIESEVDRLIGRGARGGRSRLGIVSHILRSEARAFIRRIGERRR